MQPARIEFKPSRLLRGLVLAMGLLALGAIAAASLPIPIRAALAALLIVVVGGGLHRLRKAPPHLLLATDGNIRMDIDHEWHATEVLPGSFVAPALCVLRLRIDDGRVYALTLLPDSADADALRRLRLCLRWARTRSDTAGPDAG
jgi:hypothetical protein